MDTGQWINLGALAVATAALLASQIRGAATLRDLLVRHDEQIKHQASAIKHLADADEALREQIAWLRDKPVKVRIVRGDAE